MKPLKLVLETQLDSSQYRNRTSLPLDLNEKTIKDKPKKFKGFKIKPKVDSKPPLYDRSRLLRSLEKWKVDSKQLYLDNIRTVMGIIKAHQTGKVDSHWSHPVHRTRQYHENRLNSYKRIQKDNKYIHKCILSVVPRLARTSTLNLEWKEIKQKIVDKAQKDFILFPLTDEESVEDRVFIAPPGVRRPRVYMTFAIKNAATLGTLCVELFTDVCPKTCQLFLELLDGDGVGYGYVGTRLFRKVPGLYCSGGDVVYNNGFGCYAQRGRYRPIGAENYHFTHSMPGLLSMHVTTNNEVCGKFNITFKRLHQLDFQNVVIGRIVRPCRTFEALRTLGSPLSTQPIVEIVSTRRRSPKVIRGVENTRISAVTKHLSG